MSHVFRALTLCAAWLVLLPGMSHAQDGVYPTERYPVPQPAPQGMAIPTATAARLRMLEADLAVLASRSGGRVLDGALQIAAGAAFTTIGVFVDDPIVRTLLVVTGGVGVARGVNQLAVAPDAERPAQRFVELPFATPDQLRAKLQYGEDALFMLARRTRAARLIDGTLTMAGAAAYVPLYWWLERRDDPHYRFGDDAIDYVGLALSTIAFGVGLVTVIVKSDAERYASSYRKYLSRQSGPHELTFLPRVGVSLSSQRASIVAGWRF